jgi:hypothetical protein
MYHFWLSFIGFVWLLVAMPFLADLVSGMGTPFVVGTLVIGVRALMSIGEALRAFATHPDNALAFRVVWEPVASLFRQSTTGCCG